MKNLIRLLGLLLSIALVAAACGSDSETTTDDADAADSTDGDAADGEFLVDLEGRTISIAIENAYLPFNYIDAETGEPGGWDYAAIDDICSRLNCVPDYQTTDWDGMILAVSNGQFDVAADGITITEERAEIVDFSDGYINIDQRILVNTSNDEITDKASLAASDCMVAIQGGTTNEATAIDIVGAERLTYFDEFAFVIQSVIVGDSCATIIDETAGQGYVGENADDIVLVGESLSADQLGFVFPQGSDLVEPFNQAIAAMKADGTMEALGEEYFSGAFSITYDDIE